jgi:Flp pilus assembly protein TadG
MDIQTELRGLAKCAKRIMSRAAGSAKLQVKSRSRGRLPFALLRRGERGSALVEFALILPMLMLLTTGLLVFGVAMNNYLQLTNAVSIGARALAVDAGTTAGADPCAAGSTAIQNAAPALNPSSLTYSFTMGTTTATGVTCTTAAASLVSGTSVTVTATYPLNLSVYGKVFSQSHAVLSASSTELVQ